ncbi:sulfite exporter TauE/SafE family protein [Streptomyces sp. H27-H1]|uniref:urease accessory protein UreH domain-containing protein n=1 Tax=Streptomyces sp. H27-H1 TaxID=2996461 RepID=UPI00227104C0|nr:sulfite exporter TauE/SafE family protein [Streptomyces sp. H27-H1]MCY0932270.1 sulfite exporter TauE/SafE family protein [Streptomyces sp. H27-H1]
MNPSTRRRLTAAPLAAALLTPLALLTTASPAAAHPLGNFTVNYATHLTLRPHAVEAEIVIDRAEIAAAQERPLIDQDHNGSISADEQGVYADEACTTLAGQLAADVGGVSLRWNRGTSGLTFPTGEAGLKTSRLTCRLTADAPLTSPAGVHVVTHYDTRRIGWHEITARGAGLTLPDSTVPATSTTDQLRHYPQDPLADPLDQRSADIRTAQGQGAAAARIVPPGMPGAGPVTAALNKVSTLFDTLVGSRELTVPVGLLALLLAVVLGASHAAMPGHGKTIMAAYLAGRRGTRRDAVTVGATVTLTHTAGVLALGLALPLATHLAGETVLVWLGLASGLLVTAIGLRLLHSALRGRPLQHGHSHTHGHHHHADHGHGHHHHSHHGHGPVADHGHSHEPPTGLPSSRRAPDSATADGTTTVLTKTATALPHDHHHHGEAEHHHHSHAPSRRRRWSLIGVGVAGGLVPSPSALVVLLGAVALGRTAFGILLVIGYGLGMATTLTLAGLLLVRLRERITARTAERASARLQALGRIGPAATSALVLLVGLGLTARAVTGL